MQQQPIHHYDFELYPCPFCGGTATTLSSSISCDVCLCKVEKGSKDSYEELVASWNQRKQFNVSVPLPLDQEEFHFKRWLMSRNSSNPPVNTELFDAWKARAKIQDRHINSAECSTEKKVVDSNELVKRLELLSCGSSEIAETAKDALELLSQYDGVLRSLAMSLSAGGWNSDGLINPDLAELKIKWGIDELIKPRT